MRDIAAALATGVCVVAMAQPAQAQSQEQEYNIPAGSLKSALDTYIRQSGRQVIYRVEDIRGARSNGVRGRMSIDAALDAILAQSGFVANRDGSGAVAIVRQVSNLGVQQSTAQLGDSSYQNEIIVVTGTSIRGVYPDALPLETFTSEDIQNTGAASLEQFLFLVPQNFNGRRTTAPLSSVGSGDSNGVDLRGLGAGTTLVLINGRRVASPGGVTPNISMVPIGAVERVEVLTDGASAIYGSDAIGGVVNIILKRDGQSQTGISYGTVTDGDYSEFRADQTLATQWTNGGGLISYNYYRNTELSAVDRDYAAAAAPYSLIPEDERHSVTASINHDITPSINAFADILYSHQDFEYDAFRPSLGVGGDRSDFTTQNKDQLFTLAGLRVDLTDSLEAEVTGSYSLFDSKSNTDTITAGVPGSLSSISHSESVEISGRVSGVLWSIPGGDLSFSVGGGYAHDSFDSTLNSVARPTLTRDTYYAFGEVFIPLVQSSQNIPLIDRLEVSAAGRYTDYSDFSGQFSPRVAVLYSPTPALRFRGTYTRGFRAPALSLLNPALVTNSIFSPSAFGLPDTFSSDNSTVMLLTQGPFNPSLEPEQSESYTLGIDIEPDFIPGLTITGTYYNIDYTDKVGVRDPSGGFAALFDPGSFPELFTINPTVDQIANAIENSTNFFNATSADPTDPNSLSGVVTVILDNRIVNLAVASVEGLDFGFDFETSMGAGVFSIGSRASYIIDSVQRASPTGAEVTIVDTITNPVDLRIRTYAGYSQDGLSAQLNINYFDSYENNFSTPPEPIDSWTTFDFVLNYQLRLPQAPVLDGITLTFTARNIFDSDPPFVTGTGSAANQSLDAPIGFDPANANPMGRFISFGIRKTW